MPVAAGAVAALAGAAVAPTAVRRSAGGLLPLRRATAPLKARRAAPGRRVSVAARASLGEFPAWDAVNDAAINLHASVIASDLFQISDAAAAVDTEEIVGLQKGGWLGPITNALEFTLEVRVVFLRVAHERALGAVPTVELEPRRPGTTAAARAFPTSSLRRFSELFRKRDVWLRDCPNPNPAFFRETTTTTTDVRRSSTRRRASSRRLLDIKRNLTLTCALSIIHQPRQPR